MRLREHARACHGSKNKLPMTPGILYLHDIAAESSDAAALTARPRQDRKEGRPAMETFSARRLAYVLMPTGNLVGTAGALRSQGAIRFRGADICALPVRSVCS